MTRRMSRRGWLGALMGLLGLGQCRGAGPVDIPVTMPPAMCRQGIAFVAGTTSSYDARGRTTQAVGTIGPTAGFVYDGQGKRIR